MSPSAPRKRRGATRAARERQPDSPDPQGSQDRPEATAERQDATPSNQGESSCRIRVGSTGNTPEQTDRVPIARAGEPGKPRTVVMSLGAGSDTELPLPDLEPGDLLRVFAELEVTTDYEDPNHPGLIGHPYSYAPEIEAKLLLAADRQASEPEPGRAIPLGKPWRGRLTHQQHHGVIRFADVESEVSPNGLPWSGGSAINLTVSASHPDAHRDDVLLVGENEKEKVVDQDVSGIRVVRFRPRSKDEWDAEREDKLREPGVPVAKRPVVAISKRLEDLREGEQLLVRAKLITDARPLGYHARISTRMYLADEPGDDEPKGHAQEISSWKGHLSKENGFNCAPDEGPVTSEKFGVVRVLKDSRRPLFVNLLATSAAPFRDPSVNDDVLPIRDGSFIEVIRYPTDQAG